MSNNHKQKIDTKDAPSAIGPYSQGIAIASGQRIVFVSGQLPIDPASGELIKGTIQEMTHRVIDNLEAILKAAGSNLERVVRTDVFLTNLGDFAAMNAEYAKRFTGKETPARQTIQVSALPKGAIIEISCIAVA